MDVVFMDEARKDESVPLITMLDSIGDKHPAVEHFVTIETQDTGDRRDPD